MTPRTLLWFLFVLNTDLVIVDPYEEAQGRGEDITEALGI